MTVVTRQYRAFPLREREILRYAGCRTEEEEVVRLMQTCLQEAKEADVLNGQLCYTELPFTVRTSSDGSRADTESGSAGNGTICDFGSFSVHSEQLAKNLQGCSKVLLLAATAGVGIDRLITKYGRLAPSKALMFQAIGAELVEAVCDGFSKEYEAEHHCVLRPRFSPGYGDLPLESQKDIFAVLECAKRIGLTLNDSLLMSPSKSVTAFAGITWDEQECTVNAGKNEVQSKCRICEKQDCVYRGG